MPAWQLVRGRVWCDLVSGWFGEGMWHFWSPGGICICARKIPLLLHLPEGLGRIWGDTGPSLMLLWGSGFSLHPCCPLQKVLSTFLVSGCLGFVHSRGLLLPRPGACSLLLPVAVQVQPSPARQCEHSTSPPALSLLDWLRAPFPAPTRSIPSLGLLLGGLWMQ